MAEEMFLQLDLPPLVVMDKVLFRPVQFLLNGGEYAFNLVRSVAVRCTVGAMTKYPDSVHYFFRAFFRESAKPIFSGFVCGWLETWHVY